MSLAFSDYISPTSPEEFLSECRGKRPVYFSSAPTRYASLLDSHELEQVLSRTILGQGTVRINRLEGGQVPLDEISTPVDMNRERRTFRAQAIESHLRAGATLSFEHCESSFQNVYEMCCTLAEVFFARVYATLFLVYEAERPCGLHWDDRDMFICQVTGSKNWPIYKPLYENPLMDRRRSNYYKDSAFELVQEFTLRPGDGLYIPRGWSHNPAAIEGPSMHVTFAIATPTGVDLLDWIRADLKEASAELRADLPMPLRESARHAYASRLRETILERLSNEAIDRYYLQHRSNISQRPLRLREFPEMKSPHDDSLVCHS